MYLPINNNEKIRSHFEEEEKERDGKDKGLEADGKKGSPTKQKHIWGTKNKAYLGTAQVNKAGGGMLNFP